MYRYWHGVMSLMSLSRVLAGTIHVIFGLVFPSSYSRVEMPISGRRSLYQTHPETLSQTLRLSRLHMRTPHFSQGRIRKISNSKVQLRWEQEVGTSNDQRSSVKYLT